MRMYQDERWLDFHALGREIKRKREAKGWTQEYLAQLVNRTPRSIMYFENRGQHPSLNTFYQIITLLDISVDQFFYPDRHNSESDCRQHIDRMLNSMDERELIVVEATAEGLQKAKESRDWGVLRNIRPTKDRNKNGISKTIKISSSDSHVHHSALLRNADGILYCRLCCQHTQ